MTSLHYFILAGWNVISLEFKSVGMVFRSKSTSGLVTYTVSSYTLPTGYDASLPVTIGGNIDKTAIGGSLAGIINRMWFESGSTTAYTDTTWATAYSFTCKCR